ncbi:hypothetical protein EX30DRAFT_371326 [Ascodesmis nigricans]|uniref:Uncharacterized protein n=1 Tax=Ascodesmis nigricans TaxID=341454 RepID=A0A4S2MYB8_9PEZI|nr:hypothetical protein EX30DRAFT_371326 [Ascodesmis nigricans]
MPVALRQSVRHVMGFPLESAPRNLAGVAHWSRDIVLWDIGTEQVLLHEAAHLLDMWGLQDREMKRYSDYPEFREAIIADKGCTATPYTESSYEMDNLAEIWAETLIFQRYAVEVLRISDGKAPKQWKECISNQLKVISEQTDTFLRFKYRPDKCVPKDIPGDKCCTDANFEDGKWICEIMETIPGTEGHLIP